MEKEILDEKNVLFTPKLVGFIKPTLQIDDWFNMYLDFSLKGL